MVVSPTTSEVGVPRAQGRARIRPAGAYLLRRQRIGAESRRGPARGGVVYHRCCLLARVSVVS